MKACCVGFRGLHLQYDPKLKKHYDRYSYCGICGSKLALEEEKFYANPKPLLKKEFPKLYEEKWCRCERPMLSKTPKGIWVCNACKKEHIPTYHRPGTLQQEKPQPPQEELPKEFDLTADVIPTTQKRMDSDIKIWKELYTIEEKFNTLLRYLKARKGEL